MEYLINCSLDGTVGWQHLGPITPSASDSPLPKPDSPPASLLVFLIPELRSSILHQLDYITLTTCLRLCHWIHNELWSDEYDYKFFRLGYIPDSSDLEGVELRIHPYLKSIFLYYLGTSSTTGDTNLPKLEIPINVANQAVTNHAHSFVWLKQELRFFRRSSSISSAEGEPLTLREFKKLCRDPLEKRLPRAPIYTGQGKFYGYQSQNGSLSMCRFDPTVAGSVLPVDNEWEELIEG